MNPTVKELAVTEAELLAKVKLADDLDKLHKNAAFKNVILKALFETRKDDLTRNFCQAQLNDQSKQIVEHGLISISALQSFFSAIYTEAEQCKESLEEYREMLAELRAEEGAE